MVKRYPLALILAVSALMLAGCFRQADDSFEPVTSGGTSGTGGQISPTSDAIFVPITPTGDALTLPETTQEAGAGGMGETFATVDPIIVQATQDAQAAGSVEGTPLPLDPFTQPTTDPAAPIIVTVAATNTPEVFIAPTNTPEGATGETTQEQGTFITPGVPSFPEEIITSTAPPEQTPTSTPSGLVTPTSLPEFSDECIYIVRGGDSLYRIAIVNNTTITALREANPQISGNLIRPGQRLNLPDCVSDTSAAGLTPAPTELIAPTVAGSTGGTEYIVRSGDTLYDIALRFGVTVQSIINANNMTNPNRLDIGQRLIIPTP